MLSTEWQKRSLIILAGLGALLLTIVSVEAKRLDIMLADLIKKSDVIAYGETGRDATSTPTAISFRPKQIIKGEASAEGILLCNEPKEVESYDLRKMHEPYIVFVTKGRRCYKPVHGVSSIIEVADGAARTFAIADQPVGQPLDEFIAKILSYLKGAAK